MGKEILIRSLKKKVVGKSGASESGRVTIDAKELYAPYVNKTFVDIEIKICEHDEDKLIQEITTN